MVKGNLENTLTWATRVRNVLVGVAGGSNAQQTPVATYRRSFLFCRQHVKA